MPRKFSDASSVQVPIAGLNVPERAKSPPAGFHPSDHGFAHAHGPRQSRSNHELSPMGRVKLSRTESFRVGRKPDVEMADKFKRGAVYRGSGTLKKMAALIQHKPETEHKPPVADVTSVGLDLNYIKSTVQRRQTERIARPASAHLDRTSSFNEQQQLQQQQQQQQQQQAVAVSVTDGGQQGGKTMTEPQGSTQTKTIQDIVDLTRKSDIESLKSVSNIYDQCFQIQRNFIFFIFLY